MPRPPLKLFIASLLGLAAAAVLMIGLATAAPANARETPLASGGQAYEINRDDAGELWVSDFGANQIMQVHPATGAYTVYYDLPGASDARMDATGAVWWTNASLDNTVGRLLPAAGTVTTWTLGAEGIPWGTAIDEAGQVWITDFDAGKLHRFAPVTGELCTYGMPEGTSSDYVVAGAAGIWLGDSAGNRILKLDPASGELAAWQLAAGAYPQGLAPTASGDLWWADLGLAQLGRLEPAADLVTTYALPAGTGAEMVSLAGGEVWYTESYSGTLGVLDPAAASGTTVDVSATTETLVPECEVLGPGTTTTVVTGTGTLAWTPIQYQRIVDANGWTVYDLPDGAAPWGITTAQTQVWAVDQGRRRLLTMSLLEMPAIEVMKSADPVTVPATGADVTFTFTVTNVTATQPVTITSLSDSVYGPLAGEAECQVGTTLVAGAGCHFSITRWVQAAPSGADHVNVFTAHAEDQAQVDASATDDAVVTFTSSQQYHVFLPYLGR